MTNPEDVLEAVLETEYTALKAGNLAFLTDLAAAKTAALARFPQNHASVERLSKLAARNAVLLKAAIAGVSAARVRLFEKSSSSNPLHTYTADGQRQTIRTSRPNIERRK